MGNKNAVVILQFNEFIVSYEPEEIAPLTKYDIDDIIDNQKIIKTITDYNSIIGSIDLYEEFITYPIRRVDITSSELVSELISIDIYLLYHPILKNVNNLKVPRYIVDDILNKHIKKLEEMIYNRYKNMKIYKRNNLLIDFNVID